MGVAVIMAEMEGLRDAILKSGFEPDRLVFVMICNIHH